MTAQGVLLVIFGLAAGFAMGFVQAWRLARKLECHDVVLADWDQPYDAQANGRYNVTPLHREKSS